MYQNFKICTHKNLSILEYFTIYRNGQKSTMNCHAFITQPQRLSTWGQSCFVYTPSIFPHLCYVEANSSYTFFLKKLFYVIVLSLHLYFNFILKHNIHTEMCCSSNFTK